MNDALNVDAPPPPLPAAQVISYASPSMVKPRITFRGAVATLVVGGGFLVLTIVFVMVAAALFRQYEERRNFRSALEPLGVFVAVLAGVSFILGVIVVFMGLKGVRQRETV
ncbi:MAG: hypothetical protein ACAI43_22490 [Phycisphaerae bacterium]|nr:hypothetical protein [Tepidisphaeraceae bacterium]